MAESDEALLTARLNSYSEALANHGAAIEEAYRHAEESYQHLSRVYSGRASSDFLVLWERVTDARDRYFAGAAAIKETLDDRLAT